MHNKNHHSFIKYVQIISQPSSSLSFPVQLVKNQLKMWKMTCSYVNAKAQLSPSLGLTPMWYTNPIIRWKQIPERMPYEEASPREEPSFWRESLSLRRSSCTTGKPSTSRKRTLNSGGYVTDSTVTKFSGKADLINPLTLLIPQSKPCKLVIYEETERRPCQNIQSRFRARHTLSRYININILYNSSMKDTTYFSYTLVSP